MTANGAAGVVVEAISTNSINALTVAGTAAGSGSGSGAGSGNTIGKSLTASVTTATITATAGPIRIEARDTSTIKADAGGVAIAIALNRKPETVNPGIALAASAAVNQIGGTETDGPALPNIVSATVTGSTLQTTGTGDISVLAGSFVTIAALTLSGTAAVQTLKNNGGSLAINLAGAGAGSGNAVDMSVVALVTGSTVTSGGAILVQAQLPATAGGAPTISAQAYGVTFSVVVGNSAATLNATIGAAVAVNAIGRDGGNLVRAAVENSTLSAAGTVGVLATFTPTISTIAVGVAATVTIGDFGGGNTAVGLSLAGAVTLNSIGGTTDAHVTGSTICAGRGWDATSCTAAVTVAATQTGSISATVVAANVSIGVGKGANIVLGASLATNTIGGTVTATVAGSTSRVAGSSVSVTATADNAVSAVTVAVSVGATVSGDGTAVTISGAAAVALNAITDSINAAVDAATITAGTGGVLVSASAGSSNRSITATSVAVSLGVTLSSNGIALGVALTGAGATADLGSTVHAEIRSGGTVTTTGTLQVFATSRSTVTLAVGAGNAGITIGGSGNATIGLTVTVAIARSTVTDDVRAAVLNSTATGLSVTVMALSSNPVSGTSVAVSIGFTLSENTSVNLTGAGAEVTNSVTGSTAALVSGSRLTATGGALTISAQSGAAPGTAALTQSAIAAAVTLSVAVGGSGVTVVVDVAAVKATNTSGTTTSAGVEAGSNLCAGTRSADGTCSVPTPRRGSRRSAATDTESLSAKEGAGSLSVGVGQSGGSVSVAVAVASNTVTGSTTATVRASTVTAGSVQVTAVEDVNVDTLTVALAIAIQAGQNTAIALSGAGAESTNSVGGTVSATVDTGLGRHRRNRRRHRLRDQPVQPALDRRCRVTVHLGQCAGPVRVACRRRRPGVQHADHHGDRDGVRRHRGRVRPGADPGLRRPAGHQPGTALRHCGRGGGIAGHLQPGAGHRHRRIRRRHADHQQLVRHGVGNSGAGQRGHRTWQWCGPGGQHPRHRYHNGLRPGHRRRRAAAPSDRPWPSVRRS